MEAARFASAVSALKCTVLGGRAGIPDLEETERFLKDGSVSKDRCREWIEFYRKGPAGESMCGGSYETGRN